MNPESPRAPGDGVPGRAPRGGAGCLQADGARHPCLPQAPFAICVSFPLLPSPSSSRKGRGTWPGRGGHTAKALERGQELRASAGLATSRHGPVQGNLLRKQAKRSCLGGVEGAPPLSASTGSAACRRQPSPGTFAKRASERRSGLRSGCLLHQAPRPPPAHTKRPVWKGQKTRALCWGSPHPWPGRPHTSSPRLSG